MDGSIGFVLKTWLSLAVRLEEVCKARNVYLVCTSGTQEGTEDSSFAAPLPNAPVDPLEKGYPIVYHQPGFVDSDFT
jgi:hypothetical protein